MIRWNRKKQRHVIDTYRVKSVILSHQVRAWKSSIASFALFTHRFGIDSNSAFTKSFVRRLCYFIRNFNPSYANANVDTHRSSRINQCLAPPRDPLSRAAIIIACNFISAFRDRIVKIDGGTGIGGIRNEGYYRRIRGNFTIHIFFPLGVDSPRRFSFINLLIFNVHDPTNGAIGNRVFFRVKISPISLRR